MHQADEGVQPFPSVTVYSSFCFHPPVLPGEFCCLWGENRESNTMQKRIPKLSCKHTANEKVLNVLIFLVTQWAFAWMGKAAPNQSVYCPATIMSNRPQKEPTLWRGPCFPNTFVRPKANSTLKKSIIGWLCCVFCWRCKAPNYLNRCFWSTSNCLSLVEWKLLSLPDDKNAYLFVTCAVVLLYALLFSCPS